MRVTMRLNFRLICYAWQGLRASVLPDRLWQRLATGTATATATGEVNGDGKVNDKSTLSQAVQGADIKEEGDEEGDEDLGLQPRIRQLGEAEGRGGRGRLINSIEFDIGAPLAGNWFGNAIQLQNKLEMQYVEYIPGIYQVYTSMTRNTCTWYIYQVYTMYVPWGLCWYIPGIYQVYTTSRKIYHI